MSEEPEQTSRESGGGDEEADCEVDDAPHPFRDQGPWKDRVAFRGSDGTILYPYRPHEVLTPEGERALQVAICVFPGHHIILDEDTVGPADFPFSRLTGVPDPLLLIDELTLRGIVAQVNHVYFAHSLYGNPVYGNPVYGNPVYGNPVYGNPVYGNAASGNAAEGPAALGFGNPPPPNVQYGTVLFGDKSNGTVHMMPNRSSALPKPDRVPDHEIAERINTPLNPGSPEVIVLDTGLAAPFYRPKVFNGTGVSAATVYDIDRPDEDGDHYLDPTAGHGTFIAGVITQIAPGCKVTVHRVLTTFGDGDEWHIAHTIEHLVLNDPHRTILNLSFGGYVLDEPHLMMRTIKRIQHKGVLVVASAGNDATSEPSYPAALQDVLAVGALSPTGPAYFTNFGTWVEACAPGYDVLSTFFHRFNGPAPNGPYGEDPDDFKGWALWSGTSFAAPAVVGNLARLMMGNSLSTKHAVDRLINNFSLTVIPQLGTIVDFM